MTNESRRGFLTRSMPLGAVALVAGALGAPFGVSWVRAETFTLELKHLEPPGPRQARDLYTNISAQTSYMRIGPDADVSASFAAVVKKEPAKYESRHPVRGVVTFGSHRYGFAFDSAGAKAKGYTRLYFDRNRNGDLTDDEVIEGKQTAGMSRPPTSYSVYEFSRVDVKLTVDGAETDYAFFPRSSCTQSTANHDRRVSAEFQAAVCREGTITLRGKPRRVVLLDCNSNGRFDDQIEIRENVKSSDGYVESLPGDLLLIDPQPGESGYYSGYATNNIGGGQYVSKLAHIDGHCYDLKISPDGEKLTLTPCSLPLGYVNRPDKTDCVVLYGEHGVVRIAGDGPGRLALPEGDWKLLSYTLLRTGVAAPESGRVRDALLRAGVADPEPRRVRDLRLMARGTHAGKPIVVRKAETVPLSFGPPYKPEVKVTYLSSGVYMRLRLTGTGGGVCSRLSSNYGPWFSISTPNGKEVKRGRFTAGCDVFPRSYTWRVPAEPADEYRVRVDWKDGPFEVNDTGYTVVRPSESRHRRSRTE